jgi:hypothetical protein
MRKLGLKLDALEVESFVTAPSPAAGGTVRAHEDQAPTALCSTGGPTVYSCNVARTLYESCRIQCECTGPIGPC